MLGLPPFPDGILSADCCYSAIDCGCDRMPFDYESRVSAKRLLLIACNQNFRRTLKRILCRCGYSVDASDSGEAGLVRLESTSYDAVVSEVFLPGDVCGLTLLDRARRQRPDLPVILLTEGDTARIRSALDRSDGVTCLSMPVDVDQLKRVIAARTTAPPLASSA